MIRSAISLLLVIAILAANYSKLFIFAGFELNRTQIAAELCENIDKPELNCKGKCFLSKKIKEAEEKEKNQEQQARKNHFQEAMITQEVLVKFRPTVVKPVRFDLPFDLPQRSGAIFHPPQV